MDGRIRASHISLVKKTSMINFGITHDGFPEVTANAPSVPDGSAPAAAGVGLGDSIV
jgi:hypothetical protein